MSINVSKLINLELSMQLTFHLVEELLHTWRDRRSRWGRDPSDDDRPHESRKQNVTTKSSRTFSPGRGQSELHVDYRDSRFSHFSSVVPAVS